MHIRTDEARLARMKIAEIRRANLKRLVDQYGATEIAKRCGHGSVSFISQMLAGGKAVGEKAARKIEQGMGLPPLALDAEPGKSIPFAGTDKGLIAESIRALGEELEAHKINVSSAKFAELVALVYEQAAHAGSVDREHIRRLLKLLK